MPEDKPTRRTPAQIRAGNRRLGLVLLIVVAAFFAAAIVKQLYFSAH
ncbi:cytochrome oxidase small assembly protein [Paraburkholderia acidisoli]|uniref:Cytochrome C oxidase assembly protein n=1 Tax=Paraburkholderia acidisoli TaxID=2571748 RepID=A0A7Z2GJ89_9BURK|nr:cytochrome oxidase small assembly protein [Paraburkholderia acidisoli]QGZ62822.1 cytochrome C oxidase assembly protein [Paraburkholderia acidisoli]